MTLRTTGRQFTWRLPPTPTHKVYRQLEAELDMLYAVNPRLALLREAFVCLHDFWWFTKRCTPLGEFRVADPGHPMRGRLWIEHPWLFDRIREVQKAIENRVSFILFYWARHHFKSTVITVNGTVWILARDAQETIAIPTHKIDQVGEGFVGSDIAKVMQGKLIRQLFPQFRDLEESSDTRITVRRRHGPREPSVSVHGIKTAIQGIHPTWIMVEDPVGMDTVESKRSARRVDVMLDNLIPLRGGNTPLWFIGTPYGRRDPVVQRKARGYFIGGVSFHASGRKERKPVLRTLKFLDEQYRAIQDKAIAEAQFDLVIRDPHRHSFRFEDLHFYVEPPEHWAAASNIHMIVDYAKGGDESDYTVIQVVAIRHDRKRYVLDIWREKMGQSDTLDCLFGPPAWENPASDRHAWKPNAAGGGLVARWQAFSKDSIQIWFETGGADAWVSGAKRELARLVAEGKRTYRCRIRALGAAELPKGVASKSKVSRIRILDQEFRNGMILLPAPPASWLEVSQDAIEMVKLAGRWVPAGNGFGHGSHYGPGLEIDERDTLVQLLDDEVLDWNEADGEKTDAIDDMLDTLSWHSLEELKHLFAGPSAWGGLRSKGGIEDRHAKILAMKQKKQLGQGKGRKSWRVA